MSEHISTITDISAEKQVWQTPEVSRLDMDSTAAAGDGTLDGGFYS